jgi:hypothetical protein
MARISIITLFITLISFTCEAQHSLSKKQFLADSIKIVEPKLVRPQFRFDNRLTFLKGQKLNITGFDFGVLLKNKLRVTIGYYQLSDQINELQKTIYDTSYYCNYNLKYGALNIEFIYKDTRFFSLGMPIEFGFGGNSTSFNNDFSPKLIDPKSGFVALAYFGLSGTFKPIRWIGLKGAFGYRKMLLNTVSEIALDGFYTSVGLAIDFREITVDYKLFKLKKRYRKNLSSLENAVDLITD